MYIYSNIYIYIYIYRSIYIYGCFDDSNLPKIYFQMGVSFHFSLGVLCIGVRVICVYSWDWSRSYSPLKVLCMFMRCRIVVSELCDYGSPTLETFCECMSPTRCLYLLSVRLLQSVVFVPSQGKTPDIMVSNIPKIKFQRGLHPCTPWCLCP